MGLEAQPPNLSLEFPSGRGRFELGTLQLERRLTLLQGGFEGEPGDCRARPARG